MSPERTAIRDRLASELRQAMTRMHSGSTAAEVITGSRMEPGVYFPSFTDGWVAWDYDPAYLARDGHTADTITVTAGELSRKD